MTEHGGRPVTRLGLQIPSFTYPGVSDAELFGRIAQIATTAEDSGFDSVWVMDHFSQIPLQGQRTEPMLEWYRMSQIEGDADEVGEKAQELREAGLDGLIFNMWGVQELEPVALAGQTLSKVLG
jgi:alkanesulfonate monooxygenase SsuD/methylene tetrahydromethanopterin reductase-like flavin-dependent oxidoreductase (luciferase family)